MKKTRNSLQVWQIAKVNLRHNFLPLLLLSGVVLLVAAVLFGTVGLDPVAAAAPLELLVSTIGIILLVPVFEPEQNHGIEDIVAAKYVDCIYVYIIRAMYSVIGLALLILLFCGYLLAGGCEISFALIFGTLADGMFLGSIGLLAAAVAGNLPAAFMAPVLYYGLNFTVRNKLGVFNLFSMMGGDYGPNIWLFLVSIGMLAAAVGVKRGLMKYR
ncbi:hypothetical protein IMSAGC019_01338 [Lachnospiraceae bacterium]|nr:hypothetical protein IMSAGC019_01338 [Lachnospiraceae bacterium]